MLAKFREKIRHYRNKLISCGKETWYLYCRKYFPVSERKILIQSRYGDDLGGNIFYLLKELCENHRDYKIYLVYKKQNKALYERYVKTYNIQGVSYVRIHRFRYWYLLATCKYLLNDVTFHSFFIKRKAQVYLNTWHGTPLKKMGIEEENVGYKFGNMQRNFLASDYLLFPSRYMRETMVRAYSLSNLYRGEILKCGFPRNSALLNIERQAMLRKYLQLGNKQIIAYMPTWRGGGLRKNYIRELQEKLDEIDAKLTDEQVFFVKLHPLVAGEIELDTYAHIKPFLPEYETYDFLSMADCLITDYSSVMFDFACTGKNIILFTYDLEAYKQDRGLYIEIEDLPFLKVTSVEQLLEAIQNPMKYDGDPLIQDITEHENKGAAREVCRNFLGIEKSAEKIPDNGRENVYIFVDNLPRNGITSAVFNMIRMIDRTKRNYFFVYRSEGIRGNTDRLEEIPKDVGILALDGFDKTIFEIVAKHLFFKHNCQNFIIKRYVDQCYKHNFQKYYGNVKQGYFFQFTGYGCEPLQLFKHAEKNIILIHNDMRNEIYVRKVQHGPTLIDCYRTYKKVAGVSVASAEIAENLCDRRGFSVAHNCFDSENAVKKGKEPIIFDRDTDCMLYDENGIHHFLSSGPIFITVGRFSPEKGHSRLIDAFCHYWKLHPESKLVIIGSYGPMYAKTKAYARKQECYRNICIIRGMSNPLSIMAQCDLFVMASSHEGLPVVFFEADAVGLPILSTDIDGAHEFLSEYPGGLLVEESVEGLYQGMLAFDEGNIKPLHIDMRKYNEQCIAELKQLFQ